MFSLSQKPIYVRKCFKGIKIETVKWHNKRLGSEPMCQMAQMGFLKASLMDSEACK